MKLQGKTVLITGGSAGIGLALATALLRRGNTVIATGRNQLALEAARQKVPGLHTIQSDVADPHAISDLRRRIAADFPRLDVLVNNAGVMRKMNLRASAADLRDAAEEVEINLNGPIRMAIEFLPLLEAAPDGAAIVNLSSGLAFIPYPTAPVYCATKAGLHSFTQSLRVQLKQTRIKVFEVIAPPVDTALLRPFAAHRAGPAPISAATLAAAALEGIERDHLEIRVGFAKLAGLMSRVAPGLAARLLARRLVPSS
jgi:uncharacterized oxidoreductase